MVLSPIIHVSLKRLWHCFIHFTRCQRRFSEGKNMSYTFDDILINESPEFRAKIQAHIDQLLYFTSLKLRVVHGDFYKEVRDIDEGIFLMDALNEYDRANKLKFITVQKLEHYENEVWVPWYIIDDGIRYDDPHEYIKMVF